MSVLLVMGWGRKLTSKDKRELYHEYDGDYIIEYIVKFIDLYS